MQPRGGARWTCELRRWSQHEKKVGQKSFLLCRVVLENLLLKKSFPLLVSAPGHLEVDKLAYHAMSYVVYYCPRDLQVGV